MARRIGRIVVDVLARTAKFVTGLNTATRRSKRFRRDLRSVFIGLGAYVGIRALTRQFRDMVGAVVEQQKVTAQLRAGLKSTNFVSGQTVKGLQAMSAEMQKTTVFSNEMVESAQGILLSFTNIADDVFPRTIRAAADVSTRMGQDLNATMLQLGKAINDPVANLGALSRSGIQFSKAQKTLIKSLWETNRGAEAQKLILNELERQYGGSAEAARDTLGGALQTLANEFDDLKKALGTELAPVLEASAKFWADKLPKAIEQTGTAFLVLRTIIHGPEHLRGELRMRQSAELARKNQELLATAIQKTAEVERQSVTASIQNWAKRSQSTMKAIQQISGGLKALTEFGAAESKRGFEIHKAAAIADAIVNTAAGITRAWKDLPPWAAIPMTGIIAASGAAQIAAINATTFEGGGSVPSAGGGTAEAAVGAAAGGGGTVTHVANIVLEGDRADMNQIRALLASVNEAVGDGVKLNVG